jgi:hypothetical protein
MMFVVTPSLDSIKHKFNSKSIKFPKLHKVPTLEAININKPWSEGKERLRNFGVKPPKRGIELGWVTRGTTSRKTCPLRSTPLRLAVPCDWVVTRGLLRGRFRLCRMTCTRRESCYSCRSRSGILRRRSVSHNLPL